MARFKYTAIDGSGNEKKGTIQADSVEEARSKLSAMSLMPTQVQAHGNGSASSKSGGGKKSSGGFNINLPFSKVVNQEELTLFTRQLATLLKAGVPLLRGLEVIHKQERNLRFKEVLHSLCENVRGGSALSEGLLQYPRIFDGLFVNMVRAGEAGGILEVVLDRLATFMEKSLRLRKKVKSAMVYPVVVISLAVAIVALLMVVVVPQFESIFADMLQGAELPVITQIVIDASTFVKDNFLIAAGGIIGAVILFRLLAQTPVGSKAIDTTTLALPKVGELSAKINVARFTRTFGTLLSAGVPILDALLITQDIASNYKFSDAIGRIHDQVRDGESVCGPMDNEPVFPSMVTSMVEVGEETGDLPDMLNRVADNYEEDVDNTVNGITSIIEPVMIIFLAVIVGFIVIALFLPIIRIIEELT